MTIEQRYIEAHPRSARLYERATGVLPSGVTHDSRFFRPFPIYVDRAQGSRKWDVDGNELVCYVMGHGALLLGHNHPAVAAAAQEQLARGTHYGASHELEIEWAEEVTRLVPSAEVVRFTSSGTEATLMALRLARAWTDRPGVLKFSRHFHGWHDYVVGSSSYSGAVPAGVPQGTLDSVVVVNPEMDVVRETIAGREDIGCVIVEASGAGSGTLPLPPGFLRELREFTAARGIVMIMDEVVTGFRWGAGGVQEVEGVTPDITTLAKILAGGLPGGAVAGRREVMERLDHRSAKEKIGHPGTFNANPLSAAAGVACLREAGDGSHQRTAKAIASKLREGMNASLRERGIPGYAYGDSSIVKVVLGGEEIPDARDYRISEPPLAVLERGTRPEVQRQLNMAMVNGGVHLFGNGAIVSSAHAEGDVDRTLAAWDLALAALQNEGHLGST